MPSCGPDKKPALGSTPTGDETVREFTITCRTGLDDNAARKLEQLSTLAAPNKHGQGVIFEIGSLGVDPRSITGDKRNDGVFALLSLAAGVGSKVRVTLSGLEPNSAADYMNKVGDVLAPKK
jgi:phosphotransferase system HPr-like phosphotransfer protein